MISVRAGCGLRPRRPRTCSPLAQIPVLPSTFEAASATATIPLRGPIHTLHACCLRLVLPLPVRTQDSLRGIWLRPTSAELSSARHHELLLTHFKSGTRNTRFLRLAERAIPQLAA